MINRLRLIRTAGQADHKRLSAALVDNAGATVAEATGRQVINIVGTNVGWITLASDHFVTLIHNVVFV